MWSSSAVTLRRLRDTVAELDEAGDGSSSYVAGDVAEQATAEHYAATCVERYGRISALLNNAAYEGAMGPVEAHAPDDFDRIVAVNLRGAFLGLRSVVPVMKDAGGGRIVNVSSQAGLRGVAGCAAYAASKHAIVGLSRSVALELARDRIAVNVLLPGTDGHRHDRARRTRGGRRRRRQRRDRRPASRRAATGPPARSPAPCCGCCPRRRSTSPAR